MAFGAIMGVGALALTVSNASARIVCNDEGDCWHVPNVYTYPPAVRLDIHPDGWRWRDGDRFTWREHEGRGFWRGGRWEGF